MATNLSYHHELRRLEFLLQGCGSEETHGACVNLGSTRQHEPCHYKILTYNAAQGKDEISRDVQLDRFIEYAKNADFLLLQEWPKPSAVGLFNIVTGILLMQGFKYVHNNTKVMGVAYKEQHFQLIEEESDDIVKYCKQRGTNKMMRVTFLDIRNPQILWNVVNVHAAHAKLTPEEKAKICEQVHLNMKMLRMSSKDLKEQQAAAVDMAFKKKKESVVNAVCAFQLKSFKKLTEGYPKKQVITLMGGDFNESGEIMNEKLRNDGWKLVSKCKATCGTNCFDLIGVRGLGTLDHGPLDVGIVQDTFGSDHKPVLLNLKDLKCPPDMDCHSDMDCSATPSSPLDEKISLISYKLIYNGAGSSSRDDEKLKILLMNKFTELKVGTVETFIGNFGKKIYVDQHNIYTIEITIGEMQGHPDVFLVSKDEEVIGSLRVRLTVLDCEWDLVSYDLKPGIVYHGTVWTNV